MLVVKEGVYPHALPIGRGVWVPAFAGTTMEFALPHSTFSSA